MEEITNLQSPQLIEAVRVWVGWGYRSWPGRDDERLVKHFGAEIAAKLLPLIKSLITDFYSSDAHLVAVDLQDMGRLASEQFKQKHPTVADEIVQAFAGCYTFDFK